jgi:Leucine-rich repeat (LRR) protein
LQGLFLDRNSIAIAPDDVFSGLSKLSELHINENWLKRLPSLRDLAFLKTLKADANRLVDFPMTEEIENENIETINLDWNLFTSLRPSSLSGLRRLRTLSLNDNQITAIDGVFSNLPISSLSLKNNQLVELPNDLFSALTLLTDLDLSGNVISSIPAGSFRNNGGLVTLRLRSHKLDSIPAGLFSTLSGLHLLDMRGAHMDASALPPDVFSAFGSLEILFLRASQIVELPPGALGNLRTLKALHLWHGAISEMPGMSFAPLGSTLIELEIASTQLQTLQSTAFDGLSSLRRLSLVSNKKLVNLPAAVFSQTSGLEDLSISDNAMTELPSDIFSNLDALAMLKLDRNGLEELPDFQGLMQLKFLDVSHNNVTEISANAFEGLSVVEELLMHDNTLQGLPPHVFSSLDKLKTLR